MGAYVEVLRVSSPWSSPTRDSISFGCKPTSARGPGCAADSSSGACWWRRAPWLDRARRVRRCAGRGFATARQQAADPRRETTDPRGRRASQRPLVAAVAGLPCGSVAVSITVLGAQHIGANPDKSLELPADPGDRGSTPPAVCVAERALRTPGFAITPWSADAAGSRCPPTRSAGTVRRTSGPAPDRRAPDRYALRARSAGHPAAVWWSSACWP